MRANLPAYDMKAPRTLEEALRLLSKEPGVWKPFSGGTDLMVLFEAGKLAHKKFVSLWGLPELRGISESPSHVELGALTTYGQIQAHPLLAKEFPLLVRAAAETGALAIQNRGTIAGNIANASPAADTPPALLTYEAELELASWGASRWVAYRDFHLGYKQTLLKPEEIIRRVRIPRPRADWISYYRKVGTRRAQAISKVCLAALARKDGAKLGDVRFAFASVAPTPLRCFKTEALLRGQILSKELVRSACIALGSEIAPIGDIRSSAEYRRRVAANLLEEFLSSLL